MTFLSRHVPRAALALISALAALSGGQAWAATPSRQLSVTGAVGHAATYDTGLLAALPSVTQTVTYSSGGGAQTRTYMGTSLWGLLDASAIATDAAIKNDALNHYVLATGSDGYKVVYSLGELSPGFGNRPALVAYAEDKAGQWPGLGTDGFARTTAPGDAKGGRYVSNLVNLDVRASGSERKAAAGGTSTRFTVSGQVRQAASFDLAALQALPAITQTVGANTYTGVSLWDLLGTTVGIATDPAIKNGILGMYVVATGSDGYKALFSMGELSPAFGNQPNLIAYAVNGQPLGDSGFARLVVPNDAKAGRFVSNLVSLEVFSASPVPEPGAWAMALGAALVLPWVAKSARARGPMLRA